MHFFNLLLTTDILLPTEDKLITDIYYISNVQSQVLQIYTMDTAMHL